MVAVVVHLTNIGMSNPRSNPNFVGKHAMKASVLRQRGQHRLQRDEPSARITRIASGPDHSHAAPCYRHEQLVAAQHLTRTQVSHVRRQVAIQRSARSIAIERVWHGEFRPVNCPFLRETGAPEGMGRMGTFQPNGVRRWNLSTMALILRWSGAPLAISLTTACRATEVLDVTADGAASSRAFSIRATAAFREPRSIAIAPFA